MAGEVERAVKFCMSCSEYAAKHKELERDNASNIAMQALESAIGGGLSSRVGYLAKGALQGCQKCDGSGAIISNSLKNYALTGYMCE